MEKPVVPVAEVMDRHKVFGLAGCAFSASRPGLLSVRELEHRPEVNHKAAPARRRSESLLWLASAGILSHIHYCLCIKVK